MIKQHRIANQSIEFDLFAPVIKNDEKQKKQTCILSYS
ncbi:MAG: hypothetical protein ACI8RD_007817 [Bacillariaceae sp.]|jgi:hypothetical protein